MSSPVTTSFPNFVMPAQTAAPATITVTSPPPELTAIPVGTVISAVVTPPEKAGESAKLTVSLPDGKEVSFPIKTTHMPAAEIPVSIRILPAEIKGTVALKLHFSAPLPDIRQAAEALDKLADKKPAIETALKPLITEAFVTRSVPREIMQLLPELVPPEPNASLAGMKLTVELSPEQNILPALTKPAPETPLITDPLATPIQKPEPVDVIKNIIELPKDAPSVAATKEAVQTTTPQPPQAQQPAIPSQPSMVTPSVPPVLSEGALPQPTIPPSSVTSEKAATIYMDIEEPLTGSKDILPNDKATLIADKVKGEMLQTAKEIISPRPEQLKPETRPVTDKMPSPEQTLVGAEKTTEEKAPLPNIPTSLKGIVYTPNANSPTLIATSLGILALEDKIQLPHMTPLNIKIAPLPATPLNFLDMEPLPTFKNTWTILTHALETLRQTDEAAFETVKNILPQTGNKLPALMLSFMTAAAQGKSFSAWVGESNMIALQKIGGKGEQIIKRLEKEFSTGTKKATDGQNVWRGYDIPFLSGSVVEPVSLFLQRPPEDMDFNKNKQSNKQGGVRFVLDLSLSQLGKMQLDGLAQRQQRQFDMTIRHQDTLPPEFEIKVRHIFVETLSALNYAGTLKINQTEDFIDFTPIEENDLKRGVIV